MGRPRFPTGAAYPSVESYDSQWRGDTHPDSNWEYDPWLNVIGSTSSAYGRFWVMSTKDRAVFFKCPRDAAAIVHQDVGVLPAALEFYPRAPFGAEDSREPRPVVHPDSYRFAIG